MVIVLKPDATPQQAEQIMERIRSRGCKPLHLPGAERVVLGAIGDERVLAALNLEAHPQVESVKPVLSPHKLVSREFHPHDTIVTVGRHKVGGDHFFLVTGPCAVESREQLDAVARAIKREGGGCLRASAFTPRTNPYGFQGLGSQGLDILVAVAAEHGLSCMTEVVGVEDIEAVAKRADALVLDEGNVQNHRLLKALGGLDKPVLIERGGAGDLHQLLLAAEYVVSAGNSQVMLCERGIRTFETATQSTLDLNAVPYLKQRSHLPVLVDVSRGTGHRDLVGPMARAAVACGADGVVVQAHPNPAEALSDGRQSVDLDQLGELIHGLRPFIEAAGRRL